MKEQQQPEAVKFEVCHSVRTEGQVRVELTLSNQSDQPIFAITRVRRIQLDPTTGMLTLWFSDHGRTLERNKNFRQEFSVPRTETIGAGSNKTFTANLPENMTRLVMYDDGTFDLEPLDLTQVSQVEVHIAVDDKPFYLNPSQKDFLQQLIAWGTNVSTTIDLIK